MEDQNTPIQDRKREGCQAASPQELAGMMAEYEQSHEVEGYQALGWHVWPLLRTWMTYELYGYWPPTRTVKKSSMERPSSLSRLKHYRSIAAGMIRTHTRDRRNYERPDTSKRDVVVLTNANRRVPFGKRLANRISDPFVELLRESGISSLVRSEERRVGKECRSRWSP